MSKSVVILSDILFLYRTFCIKGNPNVESNLSKLTFSMFKVSRQLFVQSWQQKQQNKVLNVFKVNNKDTRTAPVVDFEQLNTDLKSVFLHFQYIYSKVVSLYFFSKKTKSVFCDIRDIFCILTIVQALRLSWLPF